MHHCVISNQYVFLSLVEHKGRNFEKCLCAFVSVWYVKCLVLYVIQNILFCVPHIKVFIMGVNYPFKCTCHHIAQIQLKMQTHDVISCIRAVIPNTVLLGFMATWFLAASPMSLSVSVKATQLGVVLFPWSLAMISTFPCWKMPTQEQVVPKSIPTAGPLDILPGQDNV